jgi:hypothetical protein
VSDDKEMLARAVEGAVFWSLMNASKEPERADYWFRHADTLERKFTTEHGRHYSHFLPSNS